MKCGSGRYGWLPVPIDELKMTLPFGPSSRTWSLAEPVCHVNFQKYQRLLSKLSCTRAPVARDAVAGDDAVGHRPGRPVVASAQLRREAIVVVGDVVLVLSFLHREDLALVPLGPSSAPRIIIDSSPAWRLTGRR